MISLEQVRALESRVEKAVSYIAALRTENAELRRRVEEEQSFIDDAAAELEAAESTRSKAEMAAAEFERKLTDAERKLAEAEAQASELSGRIEEYRRDQSRIEEGIVHALEKLDSFEDLILGQAASHDEKAESRSISEVAVSAPGAAATPVTDARARPTSPPTEELDRRVEEKAADDAASSVDRPPADSQLDIF